MDLNPHPDRDDVAVWALDALDEREALQVETLLATDAVVAREAFALADAAAELAAAVLAPVAPSDALRARVLAAALADRGGRPPRPADAREVHAVEIERVLTLLRSLDPVDWHRPVDPPELAGWTVHDVAAHLAANEVLLARTLGAPTSDSAEVSGVDEERAAAAIARHRALHPDVAVDELDVASDAIARHLHAADPEALERTVDWWGGQMPVAGALLVRAFEIWTHADDIRRAAGLPHQPPPATSLLAMSTAAIGWLPLMVAAVGPAGVGGTVLVDLHGPGGTRLVVDLTQPDAAPRPPSPDETAEQVADAVIRTDVVTFCRAVAARVPAADLVSGAPEVADLVAAALPALARV